MAYQEQHPTTTRNFVGRSVDRKPRTGQLGPDGKTPVDADLPDGSVLTEADTGLQFVWYGNHWNPIKHPLSGMLSQILAEARKQTALLEEIKHKGA